MKQKHFFLAFFFAVISLVQLHAQTFNATTPSGHTLCYTIVDSTAHVIGYNGTVSGSLIIPDSVESDGVWYTVTDIQSNAFADCGSMSIITIPATITHIGTSAFGQVLWQMGLSGGAFEREGLGCNSLIRTKFKGTIAEWCNIVFDGPTSNPVCYSKNLYINNTLVDNLVIPDGVTEIKQYAFFECSSLTSVSFPNSVKIIRSNAFARCDSLVISLPDSVEKIEEQGFLYCLAPSEMVMPNTLDTIGFRAFYGCDANVLILSNTLSYIGGYAFAWCGMRTLTIPSSVTNIENGAFYGAYQLETLYFNAKNCQSIGMETFNWAWQLVINKVIIGDSVQDIPIGLMSSIGSNYDVIIGAIDSIGEDVFINCNNMQSITMRSLPPAISTVTFSSLSPNTPIYVPCGLMSVYQQAPVWSTLTNISETNIHFLDFGNAPQGSVTVLNVATCSTPAVFEAVVEPNSHYHFVFWNDGNTDNPRSVVLTQDTMFTPIFAIDTYYVAGIPNDTLRGTVTGSSTVVYDDSAVVSLLAIPNYGYHFNYWNDGFSYYYDNPCIVYADRNKTVVAYFVPNQYSITLSVDSIIHGTVSGAGTYNYLANRTISATANYGYHFVQWSDGNTDNPRTLPLTQDTVLTAFFAPNVYTLTVVSNDETIGAVTAGGNYNYLDTVQIVATVVAEHHHFMHWSDGETSAQRTIVMLSDITLTALFAVDTHVVSATVNDDSYGTVIGTGDYPYGSEVSLVAHPIDGYYFVKWSNDVTDNPVTFTCTGDTTLSAIFSNEVTPSLCMVNVQNNRNVVIWTKEQEVVEYKIYREGTTTGNYDLVATVPYNEQSVWVDQESTPMSRSYRYKMTAVDNWGNESPFSEVHKTMHLRISQGMGTQWNLEWNEYVGAEFITYMIYRGNAWGNLQLIDQMSVGDNTSYTDLNAPGGSVYYQVVVVKSTPCNITKSESLINSNIATNDEVGITDVDFGHINVYAADGRILVEGAEGMEVCVYDMLGRPVPLMVPTAGVYMVRVGDLPARRVVVVK